MSLKTGISQSHNVPSDAVSHPYFLQSFLFIIDHVFNEPSFGNLFGSVDRACVDKFTKLSGKYKSFLRNLESSQMLYLTFFRRSRKLFRLNNIRLPASIECENKETLYTELKDNGFISFS